MFNTNILFKKSECECPVHKGYPTDRLKRKIHTKISPNEKIRRQTNSLHTNCGAMI